MEKQPNVKKPRASIASMAKNVKNVGKVKIIKSKKPSKIAGTSRAITKASEETKSGNNAPNEKRVVASDGVELFLFYKKNSCFSNFYPCEFTVDGIPYTSSEQFYMHQKAITFEDNKIAADILKSDNPVAIKKLGRKVENFTADRWNSVSDEIMEKGLLAKFQQNELLKASLLSTESAIIAEASPRDKLWGIGLGVNNAKALDHKNWPGKNKLGTVLMKVRDALKDD